MWLFTKVGFFSVVQTDEGDLPKGVGALGDVLSVRARIEGDLDALRSAYAPDLTETIMLPGRDYPYRGFITKEKLSEAMVRMTLDLDYGNFKSMVSKVQGYDRAHLYSALESLKSSRVQMRASSRRSRVTRPRRMYRVKVRRTASASA